MPTRREALIGAAAGGARAALGLEQPGLAGLLELVRGETHRTDECHSGVGSALDTLPICATVSTGRSGKALAAQSLPYTARFARHSHSEFVAKSPVTRRKTAPHHIRNPAPSTRRQTRPIRESASRCGLVHRVAEGEIWRLPEHNPVEPVEPGVQQYGSFAMGLSEKPENVPSVPGFFYGRS